jgi:hypothetical protein
MTSAARDTSSRTARDALRDEIADLSEPMAQEVLDFILFVKHLHAEQPRQTADPEVADDNR